MFKPISTRTHGVIDCVFAASLVSLPFLLRWNARATRLSVGAGLATLATSLLTNYEFGMVGLLPMKAHLSMDAAENSMLLSAPRILGQGGGMAARILAAAGAMGSAVGALTKTRSPRELPAGEGRWLPGAA